MTKTHELFQLDVNALSLCPTSAQVFYNCIAHAYLNAHIHAFPPPTPPQHTHTDMHAHMRAHTHAYMRAHTHTHTCTTDTYIAGDGLVDLC